jgi:hypothetical protein
MSHRIAAVLGTLVLVGTGILAAADVVQLPTQTLGQYDPGTVANWTVNFQIVPTFRQSAYTGASPARPGRWGMRRATRSSRPSSAPAGERFVITPGTAPTYLHLDADFLHAAGGNGSGGPVPVSFAGLSGTAPLALATSFTAGADSVLSSLEFSADWSVPAPFSFTSVTFTGTVGQEPVVTDTTFERVNAILFAYEPDPPGSASDQLLSVQPIPEPAGMIAILTTAGLLLRRRTPRSPSR